MANRLSSQRSQAHGSVDHKRRAAGLSPVRGLLERIDSAKSLPTRPRSWANFITTASRGLSSCGQAARECPDSDRSRLRLGPGKPVSLPRPGEGRGLPNSLGGDVRSDRTRCQPVLKLERNLALSPLAASEGKSTTLPTRRAHFWDVPIVTTPVCTIPKVPYPELPFRGT